MKGNYKITKTCSKTKSQ